jgi:hypothetical protein
MNRSMLSPCRPAIGHTSGVAADVAVAGRLICKRVQRSLPRQLALDSANAGIEWKATEVPVY